MSYLRQIPGNACAVQMFTAGMTGKMAAAKKVTRYINSNIVHLGQACVMKPNQ